MSQWMALAFAGGFLLAFFVAVLLRGHSSPVAPVWPAGSATLTPLVSLPGLHFRHAPILFDRADHEMLTSSPRHVALAADLLAERKRLASMWLRMVQQDVVTLWRLRRVMAGQGATGGGADEMRLVLSAFLLLATIALLRAGVALIGPFALTGALNSAGARLAKVQASLSTAFASLPAARQAEIRGALQAA
jgi:hypothetical protein